jgi:ribulose-5-phosphate 4-epimerase/fuculose-1-phosphate aldolase
VATIEETLAQEFVKNPMAPPVPELSPQAEVALLARTLFREGYDDHLSGHITSRQDDGTLLVNPFGLPWDEIKASDVMRIDLDGHTLEGKWTVTPAITLHTELHRRREDVKVAVHNHPVWGTIWANAQRIPPAYDQTSAQVLTDDIALFDEFDGPVQDVANATAAVEAMGDHNLAMLANHGVFVLGVNAAQVHHRATTLEWRCRNAWRTEALGNATELKPDVAVAFGKMFQSPVAFPGLWEASVRRELRLDPSVLD